MRRTDSKCLCLFHRLGILLVILGLMQSLAPSGLWLAPPSVRASRYLRIARIALDDTGLPARMLPADPSDATESRAEQESDQDTPDTENPAENLAWPEVLAVRLSAERSSTASAHWPIPQPGRGARRTRSALQHARALPIVASASSRVTTRLCRFLC